MDPDIEEGHPPMSFEKAQRILEESQIVRIDNVFPWWTTLRKPFLIMSTVLAIMSLAIILLANSLRIITAERAKENERTACYNLFTNASSDAIREVRATGTRVNNAGWSALVRVVSDIEIDVATVENVDRLIAKSEAALELDLLRIQQRDAWVAEGRPLPNGECPIPAVDYNQED